VSAAYRVLCELFQTLEWEPLLALRADVFMVDEGEGSEDDENNEQVDAEGDLQGDKVEGEPDDRDDEDEAEPVLEEKEAGGESQGQEEEQAGAGVGFGGDTGDSAAGCAMNSKPEARSSHEYDVVDDEAADDADDEASETEHLFSPAVSGLAPATNTDVAARQRCDTGESTDGPALLTLLRWPTDGSLGVPFIDVRVFRPANSCAL